MNLLIKNKFICLLFVVAVLLQCSKTEEPPVTPATTIPTITSFSPMEGSTGTSITIIGTNFAGTSSVSFGDTLAASFVLTNATTVTAIVGNGANFSCQRQQW